MEPSIQGLRQDFSTTSGTRPFSPAHAFTLFSRELCRAELTLLSQEDDLDVAMEASCRLIRFGNRLHFRLLDLGWSQRAIVLCYWLFCAAFGVLSVLISSRLYKLVSLLLLAGLVLGLLVVLSRRQGKEEIGD